MAIEPKAGGKVAVGCKLPHGLILHLEKLEDTINEITGMKVKRWVQTGEQVRLNGSNTSGVIGGYGITEGVDEAWFTAWLAAHAAYEPVRAGLIFAMPTASRAQDRAREQADVKSGLEPMDPDKPGRGLEPAPTA